MGLFDSVMGAVTGGAKGGEGLQGLLGSLGIPPDLLKAAGSLLGGEGGLQGLVDRFHQGGLGDIVNSLVGKGDNLPITGEQLSGVLGADTLSGLGGELGMDSTALAEQLSTVLPGLVNQLTPDGQVPAAGAGGASGDLMGMLGGLIKG